MATQSKAIAQSIENAAPTADDRWSPVHLMMFCTVVSFLMWCALFAAARWAFS